MVVFRIPEVNVAVVPTRASVFSVTVPEALFMISRLKVGEADPVLLTFWFEVPVNVILPPPAAPKLIAVLLFTVMLPRKVLAVL